MLVSSIPVKDKNCPLISEQTTGISPSFQKTIVKAVSCQGIGVHSGNPVTMTLKAGDAHTGFVFVRTDINSPHNHIQARWDKVTDTAMCTKITNDHDISVSTIEHVIAALAGCGIDNAVIELDGPEVPIMDGSSKVFVDMIHSAGSQSSYAPIRYIRVLKPVEVKSGDSIAQLTPSSSFNLKMHFNANGRLNNRAWSLSFNPTQQNFIKDLASARTFGFYEDAQRLWAAGLAQGASLDNTIVIQSGEVMNEEGLRYDDEFVRHKALDALGDLALAGNPLLAQFEGSNSGHGLNNQLLRALFASPSAWCFEEAHPAVTAFKN